MNAYSPTIEADRATARPAIPEQEPDMLQFAYVRMRWHENQVQFTTIDGGWTSDISRAYMLPKASDFNWNLHHRNDPSAPIGEVRMSLHGPMLHEGRDGKNSSHAPVIAEWRDYIRILTETDAQGREIPRKDTPIVSHHGVRDEGRDPVATRDLIRAVAWTQIEHGERTPIQGSRIVRRYISITPAFIAPVI